jgi:esterase/lipase
MPFRLNDSEHPAINYRHMPLRGLHELRLMVDELGPRLADVACPVMLAQGTDDPVVDPRSAEMILDKLGSREKILHKVPSDRHGILNENTGGVQETVMAYLASLAGPDGQRPAQEAATLDTRLAG